MKLKKIAIFVLMLCMLSACKNNKPGNESAKTEGLIYQEGIFTPDWKSFTANYKVPEWYKKARFGIWVHASPQDVGEVGDWYARNIYLEGSKKNKYHIKKFGHPSEFGYKDICNEWKLENWKPDEMMALYKKAGAKFFVAMGNHHCNFDMWDSKYQEWNSVNIGPKRDVLGEWKKAADKYGIKFGTSLHALNTWGWYDTGRSADTIGTYKGVPYDIASATKEKGKGKWWEGYDPYELYGPPHQPEEDGDPPSKEIMLKLYNRFKDVVEKYELDYLYWDAHHPGVWRQFVRFDDVMPADAKRSLRETPFKEMGKTAIAHFYNSSIKRNGTLEAVTTIKSVPDSLRTGLVEDFEHHTPKEILPYVWERGYPLGGWHYSKGRFKKKRTKQLLTELIDVISKNGVFLMNVPMSPRGEHDPLAIATLEELADWMQINGEAVYESNPWKKFGDGNIRYTQKNDFVYVFIPNNEAVGTVMLKDFGVKDGKITSCELLGVNKLDWKQNNNSTTVKFTKQKTSKYVQVVKIGID